MEVLRKLITQLFFRIVSPEYLLREYHRRKLNAFLKYVKLGENSKLTDAATVYNQALSAEKIIVGSGSTVEGELQVFRLGGSISIGDNCYIGRGSRIWSMRKIMIGNDVFISHNVNVMDTNGHSLEPAKRANAFANGVDEQLEDVESAPVLVNDGAWIGFNAIILKGVTIGKGAIIAAGSIITEDVPDHCIVAGPKATLIGKI